MVIPLDQAIPEIEGRKAREILYQQQYLIFYLSFYIHK